jgi:DNA replication protein DnaC
VEELMTQLKLPRIRQVYQDWIDKAAKEEMSYADFLYGLLTEETCQRTENQILRRMRVAAFPFEKTIEQFDFQLRPELKRQVILNCMDPTFIHQGRSLGDEQEKHKILADVPGEHLMYRKRSFE